MSLEYKLIEGYECASCGIENAPLAKVHRRGYLKGRDTEDSAKVSLCQVCNDTGIGVVTVHYPSDHQPVLVAKLLAQVTHLLLAEIRGLKDEVIALRADLQGTEEESEPRPDLKTCVNCARDIKLVDGAWLDTGTDLPGLCELSKEFGSPHNPKEEEDEG